MFAIALTAFSLAATATATVTPRAAPSDGAQTIAAAPVALDRG